MRARAHTHTAPVAHLAMAMREWCWTELYYLLMCYVDDNAILAADMLYAACCGTPSHGNASGAGPECLYIYADIIHMFTYVIIYVHDTYVMCGDGSECLHIYADIVHILACCSTSSHGNASGAGPECLRRVVCFKFGRRSLDVSMSYI
jgi:hypothetical protein